VARLKLGSEVVIDGARELLHWFGSESLHTVLAAPIANHCRKSGQSWHQLLQQHAGVTSITRRRDG
jgi:hypothetical protein